MDSADGPQSSVEARVAGGSVERFLEGVERVSAPDRETVETALADCGVGSVRSEEWYPLSAVLDAAATVAEAVGTDAIAAGGWQCGNVVADDAMTVPEALAALDGAYRRHHRGDAGGYGFRQIGPTDGRIECSTPYPCVLDRALVEGVARTAADSYVSLAEVSTCRDDGAERCTYELSW